MKVRYGASSSTLVWHSIAAGRLAFPFTVTALAKSSHISAMEFQLHLMAEGGAQGALARRNIDGGLHIVE
jgi:hypothetical protein